MKNKFKYFFICCFFFQLQGVTIVYNLRISEITKRQQAFEQFRKPSVLAGAVFTQLRERYSHSKQTIIGGLTTYLYSGKSFYFKTDFAFANVSEKLADVKFSRTQTDDILFSGGVNYKIGERTRLTFSGLFGLPTHKDTGLQGIQFGTGHVGIGLQLDGSYNYSQTRNAKLLLFAFRYLRFLARDVDFIFNNQKFNLNFDLGNVVDLFFANQHNWGKHRLEYGYNPAFAFGAKVKNSCLFKTIEDQAEFSRSSFYVSYLYRFLLKKNIPAGTTLAFSYSFDHQKNLFNFKSIFTFFAGFGISF